MAGQLKVTQLQLGDNATATQNFVWQTNNDGTAKLARGNVGATSQDILTVGATGLITLTQGVAVNGVVGLTVYTTTTTPLPAVGVYYTASHSLGIVPADVVLEITCITAELGYSVGDVVGVYGFWNGSNTCWPIGCYRNSTTVGMAVYTGDGVVVANKSTGYPVSPTAANWSYRFKMRTS